MFPNIFRYSKNTMSSWKQRESRRPLTQKELEEAIANLSESEDDLDISSDEEDTHLERLDFDNQSESINELYEESDEVFDLANIPIFLNGQDMTDKINLPSTSYQEEYYQANEEIENIPNIFLYAEKKKLGTALN